MVKGVPGIAYWSRGSEGMTPGGKSNNDCTLSILALVLTTYPLQWRHNGRDGVTNHQPHGCLLHHLFRHRLKKTSKHRVTGLCAENSPVTGELSAEMVSNAEHVSIGWRHHDLHGWPSTQSNRIAHNLAAHYRTAINPAARWWAGSVVCNLSRQKCSSDQRWTNVDTIVLMLGNVNLLHCSLTG